MHFQLAFLDSALEKYKIMQKLMLSYIVQNEGARFTDFSRGK